MKLSLCIATYNEEKNIHYPLNSAYDLVDEVIIVDGGSTDKTVEVAASYGKKVKVYREKFERMFHINKQKAIERAKGEWILQLDADEALSDELKEEIKAAINPKPKKLNTKQIQNTNKLNSKQFRISNFENLNLFRVSDLEFRIFPVAFYIPRKNFFLTRFLLKGGQYPDYTIRFYRNGYARFPCKDVHENVEIIDPKRHSGEERSDDSRIDSGQARMTNKIGYLNNPILHFADPTFSRYLQRWDRYTSLEAEILIKKLQPTNYNLQIIFFFFDYFLLKPPLTFFSIYFRHLGFLDGFPGFVFALFSSIRFWVIYIKWWQLKKSKIK